MTEPLTIDVWSDFVCPYCFLVSSSLARLKASHGVEVRWRSYELRPPGSPPMDANFEQYIAQAKPRMQAYARDYFGITDMTPGPIGVSSRPALVGAKYAEAQGVGDVYHQRVFTAYFMEGRAIDDREWLVGLAVDLGLDGAAFGAALDAPAYIAAVEDDVAQAMGDGIQSVPALVFAGKYLISGAQPYERLVQATEQVQGLLAGG